MIYTQKDIYDYLCENPLNAHVAVGDVKSMNGEDYILLDYQNDAIIPSDNSGVYQTYLQITVATTDFEKRKTLTDYIKKYFSVSVTYEKSIEFEYYVARCSCGVLLYEDS